LKSIKCISPFCDLAVRRLAAAAAASLALCANAQDYPSKPIRAIVPVPAAGAIDLMVRGLGESLRARLGQGFIVENRAGGVMVIAANACKASAPDGYTLCIFTQNAVTLNPWLIKNLPYDPLKDFEPVSLIGYQQQAFLISTAIPVNSFKELIEYSKKNPDKLNYGSLGTGSGSHLSMEWLQNITGARWTHIPYSGSTPVIQAVLGGQTHMFQLTVASDVMGQVKAGKMKALIVPGDKRNAQLPDTPTYAEAGLPKLEALPWTGAFMPAGTPKPLIDRMSREIGLLVKTPEFQQKYLLLLGFDGVGNSADEFKAYLAKDINNQRALVDIAGLKPQ
jgi:tripartite-type tricarboxylate transporter receptor subunit TctC